MRRMSSPFATAEKYIQLRKVWSPKSMGDYMMRINELIITPLITIFLIFLDQTDFIGVISALLSTGRAWMEYIQYQTLRFDMQMMYLQTMKLGGPFIVTNDTDYLPYVYADAVVRHGMLRPDSATVHQRAVPLTHTL